MPDTSPPVGARIALNNSLGTVRYVGPVDGTHGTWLGVEWDDPQRGKHDGCKDGTRYFRCATDHPTAASFIRPAVKGLSYGRSFLAALAEKYIDDSPAPSKEVVTLGSSHGLIQVEAVGLAKVRSNLADLARLVEVSLDGAHIAWAEQPPQVAERCPNIRGLDLSLNLLPSWPALATLTAQLPHLTRLALNSTRLALSPLPASPPSPPLPTSFQSLTELQLNATLTPWPSLLTILAFLPSLHTLEAGYNSLSLPSPLSPSCPAHVHANLALLNLDTNLLAALPALSPLFPALTRLVLASNRIAAIPPAPSAAELGTLKHLSLSGNPLADWASVDNLRGWCPALEGLAIRAIPLLDGSYTRAFAIAKLPTLTSLDGAPITPKDRLDAELLYLSHITQHVPAPDRASWGRYAELVESTSPLPPLFASEPRR
ncbi:hypothetical protein GLOTRDRAFT_71849 [Gloeophyllum trabeum ATCC 11539]|uniref:CAP-Gly domain-containing protein n=1 Tax=Gloeophyllum trabeum (strain ATCC 11539 / FP-39264 / Madison 617) TaxID=670483 RepID=S7QF32_GLOTA|nr:uncharacterized protein GLOTRDRAFT_71849 [Gloeophyllum trabeum ATCC 11539]EPQ57923.1 hypothetical protein GLOTRDRAFT_71849 [Gloeophyllum trabeum ATCC 11539]